MCRSIVPSLRLANRFLLFALLVIFAGCGQGAPSEKGSSSSSERVERSEEVSSTINTRSVDNQRATTLDESVNENDREAFARREVGDLLDLIPADYSVGAMMDLDQIRATPLGKRLQEAGSLDTLEHSCGIRVGQAKQILLLFKEEGESLLPLLLIRTELVFEQPAMDSTPLVDLSGVETWLTKWIGEPVGKLSHQALDPQTLLVMPVDALSSYDRPSAPTSRIGESLRHLTETSQLGIAWHPEETTGSLFPQRLKKLFSIEATLPDAALLESITLQIELTKDPCIEIAFHSRPSEEAEENDEWNMAVQEVISQFMTQFATLQQYSQIHPDNLLVANRVTLLETMIEKMELSTDEKEITITIRRPEEIAPMIEAIAALLPAESQSTDTGAHEQAQLARIGEAILSFHKAYKMLPPVASTDERGKALLSWRVHLLPFLGYDDLYSQFHFDEPWNSTHNRRLLEFMPPVYSPADPMATEGETTLLVFTGGETPLSGEKQHSREEMVENERLASTILVIAVPSSRSVPWTQPVDLSTDEGSLQALLVESPETGYAVLQMDGIVLRLPKAIDMETLRNRIFPKEM